MTHSYRAVLFTITLSVFVSVSSVPSFALTGDVDPINKTPECISLVNNIRYGDSDAVTKGPITKLQTFLIDEGYMKGEATGYFGAVTFASVKRYQTARGLTDSGYVGEYTRAAVKADTCAEVTKPAPVVQQQATTSAAVFGPTSPTSTSAPAVTGGAVFGGSATVTCTESRGTFTNSVGQLIEWSCGCANPPAGGAWVSVGGSCFHQIVQ